MSIDHLRSAIASGNNDMLMRYIRLHFGDGNEAAGRAEIEKSWIVALRQLVESPPTNRSFIEAAIAEQDVATLAHLFFRLHFHFVSLSEEWIHDGTL